ncbi:g2815 [Coccomyxa elongata]
MRRSRELAVTEAVSSSISDPLGAPLQGEEQRAEDIALIKEIAPSYGDGFIGACLAACGGDSQRTTNMLLEGKFPGQLALLDRHTGKAPGGERTTTETGDPRAAWMGSGAAADLPVHPTTPAAADHKDHPKHGAPEPHTAHGVSQFGDPRAAWVHSGANTTEGPPTHHPAPPAKDEEGRFFKAGDPRAQ